MSAESLTARLGEVASAASKRLGRFRGDKPNAAARDRPHAHVEGVEAPAGDEDDARRGLGPVRERARVEDES